MKTFVFLKEKQIEGKIYPTSIYHHVWVDEAYQLGHELCQQSYVLLAQELKIAN